MPVFARNLTSAQPHLGTDADVKSAIPLKNEIIHNESGTTIKVEIPGVDPSTVEVDCKSNILTVSCELGEFIYSVDPTIDTLKIKADAQWGLLTVTVPSAPVPASRSIKVNIHDAVKTAPSKTPAKFTKED
jgi:HSP20 family molecular chaperone IbpA